MQGTTCRGNTGGCLLLFFMIKIFNSQNYVRSLPKMYEKAFGKLYSLKISQRMNCGTPYEILLLQHLSALFTTLPPPLSTPSSTLVYHLSSNIPTYSGGFVFELYLLFNWPIYNDEIYMRSILSYHILSFFNGNREMIMSI